MFQTLSSRWCNFAQGSHACATIVPRRRRSQGKCRMTLGGVTGLQDCLLLPPVRAKTEDSCSREYLLLTCLRLHVQAGTRPMGICVDNLEQCFQAIARSLQAAYPAQVQLCYGEEWPLPHEAEDGHIYIQMTQKKSLGIWLCEDPLHCYKRILDSINFASREAAFLARSLQVLLSTWNPARRIHGKTEFEIGKKCLGAMHGSILYRGSSPGQPRYQTFSGRTLAD